MSKETNLDAEIRAESGKSAVKKVLAAGKIPSVIYGLGEDSLCLLYTSPSPRD